MPASQISTLKFNFSRQFEIEQSFMPLKKDLQTLALHLRGEGYSFSTMKINCLFQILFFCVYHNPDTPIRPSLAPSRQKE